MEKEKREQLKKKIKVHEKLGALKFQKVVFGVEKAKFKLLKKLWPNFIIHYDKYCDFMKRRAIKKAKTPEEIKQISRKTKFSKMAMRKELNQEKNANYHMDEDKPTEIYKYLQWNKKVHKRGIIKNAVLIPVIATGIALGAVVLTPLLIMEIVSAGINFECINIQDYNICRYKLMEEKLIQKEQKKTQKNIEEYGEASSVIYKTIEAKEDLPTLGEVIDNVENSEQLEQLKKLLIEEQARRKQAKEQESGVKGESR